jgi:uncharacterized protein YjcR
MPKDIGVDWKMVESEYLKGTRPSEIARLFKLNPRTLKTRMTRGGWVAKRLSLIEAVEAKETAKSIQTLSSRASGYLARVVKEVDKGLDVLSTSVPATVKEVDQHFEALSKIDRVARPALGLTETSNSKNGSVINIAVLQQLAENEPVKSCQETLEVQSSPLS